MTLWRCGGACRQQLHSQQQIRHAASSSLPRHGYRQREYGLEWHSSRDKLLASGPGPVLVSSSYTFEGIHGGLNQAMKYSSFNSHWSYWETLQDVNRREQLQSIHELIPASSPRSLYFDIDGATPYRELHQEIIAWLRLYVRWVFSGDRLGWDDGDPEPVVLKSENPQKYSCHVVFPQIQFANHEAQAGYMKVLLTALSKLQVEFEGSKSVPILERVVDTVPYTQFQNFRGPYACKIKNGELRLDTQLLPDEDFLTNNELSFFASHTDSHQALELPTVDELLEHNAELREYYEHHANRIMASGSSAPSMQDFALYETVFQQRGGGMLDFGGKPELEIYEEALRCLHPERACQWWSWFRISGVTHTILEKYGKDAEARRRIWRAHNAWSSQYSDFDAQENIDMVEKCRGKRVSGLPLLMRLVRFDNPDMEMRTGGHRIYTPSQPPYMSVLAKSQYMEAH
jgi:hypothetical protein